MNYGDAADIRDRLNELDVVEGPDDDAGGSPFKLARIHQPGYTNGEPTFEVLLMPTSGAFRDDSVHIPGGIVALVAEFGGYLRVDTGDGADVHIRSGP